MAEGGHSQSPMRLGGGGDRQPGLALELPSPRRPAEGRRAREERPSRREGERTTQSDKSRPTHKILGKGAPEGAGAATGAGTGTGRGRGVERALTEQRPAAPGIGTVSEWKRRIAPRGGSGAGGAAGAGGGAAGEGLSFTTEKFPRGGDTLSAWERFLVGRTGTGTGAGTGIGTGTGTGNGGSGSATGSDAERMGSEAAERSADEAAAARPFRRDFHSTFTRDRSTAQGPGPARPSPATPTTPQRAPPSEKEKQHQASAWERFLTGRKGGGGGSGGEPQSQDEKGGGVLEDAPPSPSPSVRGRASRAAPSTSGRPAGVASGPRRTQGGSGSRGKGRQGSGGVSGAASGAGSGGRQDRDRSASAAGAEEGGALGAERNPRASKWKTLPPELLRQNTGPRHARDAPAPAAAAAAAADRGSDLGSDMSSDRGSEKGTEGGSSRGSPGAGAGPGAGDAAISGEREARSSAAQGEGPGLGLASGDAPAPDVSEPRGSEATGGLREGEDCAQGVPAHGGATGAGAPPEALASRRTASEPGGMPRGPEGTAAGGVPRGPGAAGLLDETLDATRDAGGAVPSECAGDGTPRGAQGGTLGEESGELWGGQGQGGLVIGPLSQGGWRKLPGRSLGKGRFGTVWRAECTRTGARFAVKSSPRKPPGPPVAGSQNAEEELVNEGNLLGPLNHPHIVRCLGGDADEHQRYLFLELLDGTLSELCRHADGTPRPLPEGPVRRYTRHVLLALDYLHERFIMHRDLKAKNLLYCRKTDSLKLADFGSARKVDPLEELEYTQGRGTPLYTAPEVLSNTKYDRAADVWSLGCTVIEMVTGDLPWRDLATGGACFLDPNGQPNMNAALHFIGQGKSTPPIPPNLSQKGKNFLALCLQLDAKNRPPPRVLLEDPFVDLDEIQADADRAAAGLGPAPAVRRAAPAPAAAAAAEAAAAAAAAVAAAAAAQGPDAAARGAGARTEGGSAAGAGGQGPALHPGQPQKEGPGPRSPVSLLDLPRSSPDSSTSPPRPGRPEGKGLLVAGASRGGAGTPSGVPAEPSAGGSALGAPGLSPAALGGGASGVPGGSKAVSLLELARAPPDQGRSSREAAGAPIRAAHRRQGVSMPLAPVRRGSIIPRHKLGLPPSVSDSQNKEALDSPREGYQPPAGLGPLAQSPALPATDAAAAAAVSDTASASGSEANSVSGEGDSEAGSTGRRRGGESCASSTDGSVGGPGGRSGSGSKSGSAGVGLKAGDRSGSVRSVRCRRGSTTVVLQEGVASGLYKIAGGAAPGPLAIFCESPDRGSEGEGSVEWSDDGRGPSGDEGEWERERERVREREREEEGEAEGEGEEERDGEEEGEGDGERGAGELEGSQGAAIPRAAATPSVTPGPATQPVSSSASAGSQGEAEGDADTCDLRSASLGAHWGPSGSVQSGAHGVTPPWALALPRSGSNQEGPGQGWYGGHGSYARAFTLAPGSHAVTPSAYASRSQHGHAHAHVPAQGPALAHPHAHAFLGASSYGSSRMLQPGGQGPAHLLYQDEGSAHGAPRLAPPAPTPPTMPRPPDLAAAFAHLSRLTLPRQRSFQSIPEPSVHPAQASPSPSVQWTFLTADSTGSPGLAPLNANAEALVPSARLGMGGGDAQLRGGQDAQLQGAPLSPRRRASTLGHGAATVPVQGVPSSPSALAPVPTGSASGAPEDGEGRPVSLGAPTEGALEPERILSLS